VRHEHVEEPIAAEAQVGPNLRGEVVDARATPGADRDDDGVDVGPRQCASDLKIGLDRSRVGAAGTVRRGGDSMAQAPFSGSGTADDPWVLKTPSLGSEILMHRDELHDPPILVCTVGSTVLHYDLRIIDDLHRMLQERGDWVPLGNADEQKPAAEGTVEAWARSPDNPVGGWYGLKKGLRGRVGNYVPPVLEALGLAEVEHNARGNRMRAI
jgi:hypothetical protein